jgi:magnesium chelatase subunit I
MEKFQPSELALRDKILRARARLPNITVADELLEQGAKLCIALGTDGLRGELTLMRAARALAAFEGADVVSKDHLRAMTAPALRHRLRRDPLDDSLAGTRVERAVAELFA